jgi:gamma-tubulin complex component 2
MKGVEGTYITFDPEYSPEDDDPLQGIRFMVSTSLGEILPSPF